MKKTKVSQTQIGNELNLSQSTVAQMFNRPREIDSIRYVEAISKLTGYSLVWLMFGSYEMILTDLNEGISLKKTKK